MEIHSGNTIQIYLPDGDPQSIKIAEITSRTIQALLIHSEKKLTGGKAANYGQRIYFYQKFILF